MSAILLFVGSAGWCWPVLGELRSLILVSPAAASIHRHVSLLPAFNRCRGKADSEIGKLDPFDSSIYAPSAPPHLTPRLGTRLGHESRARIVARKRSRLQTRFLERGHARLKHAAKELKPSLKPPVRLASLEGAAPPVEATPSHIPSNAGALTSLVDFETAPFPYHGTMPDFGPTVLECGAEGHWGHINFRAMFFGSLRFSVTTACCCTFRQALTPNAPRSGRVFSRPRRQSRQGRTRPPAGAGADYGRRRERGVGRATICH